MKKIFALLALASVFMGSFAQDVVPEEKYSIATNSFGSNWFVQAGLDWNAWYSAEERGHDLSKSPFKKFRSNPGISLAFGKWFTPGIGLRTKIQGFWGKKVDADWNEDTNEGNGNKYWVANEQVMKSLKYAYTGRKLKKRDFRRLWITRITAGVKPLGLNYSRFMYGLKKANIDINRKMLSDLAVNDKAAFAALVEKAKAAL